MKRNLMKKTHATVGALALLIILTFFLSTIIVEMSGSLAAIATVKRYIAFGLFLLVPAMAAVGFSGSKLSGRSRARLVVVKKKRMKVVAANGLLVLVPCALVLYWLARSGSFGTAFYIIQGIELIAGPVNIALIGLNVRDGLRLSGRLPKRPFPPDVSAGL